MNNSRMYPRHEGFGGVHPFEAIEGHQRNMVSGVFYGLMVYLSPDCNTMLARCYKKGSRGSGVRHNGRGWYCLYSRSRWVIGQPLLCETLNSVLV